MKMDIISQIGFIIQLILFCNPFRSIPPVATQDTFSVTPVSPPEPQNQLLDETGILTCNYTPPGGDFISVVWRHGQDKYWENATRVYSYVTPGTAGTSYGNLTDRGNHTHERTQMKLIINDVKETDDGNYFCQIIGANFARGIIYNFTAMTNIVNCNQHSNTSMIVDAGANVTLTARSCCSRPAVVYEWINGKNGTIDTNTQPGCEGKDNTYGKSTTTLVIAIKDSVNLTLKSSIGSQEETTTFRVEVKDGHTPIGTSDPRPCGIICIIIVVVVIILLAACAGIVIGIYIIRNKNKDVIQRFITAIENKCISFRPSSTEFIYLIVSPSCFRTYVWIELHAGEPVKASSNKGLEQTTTLTFTRKHIESLIDGSMSVDKLMSLLPQAVANDIINFLKCFVKSQK